MEFKFNFDVSNASGAVSPDAKNAEAAAQVQEPTDRAEEIAKCRRITATDIVKHWTSKTPSDFYSVDSVTTVEGGPTMVVISPSNPSCAAAGEAATDLVPSVYEGGFKVWECTRDMIRFLERGSPEGTLRGETVLDAGCGVGLLGIYALAKGNAARVSFQDFNEDVVWEAAGPSALVNLHPWWKESQDGAHDFDFQRVLQDKNFALNLSERSDFWAGDWSNLTKSAEYRAEKYSVILSSETIYNPSYYEKLHDFLSTSLAPGGVVYMSAKCHYFGVGGGVSSWLDFVKVLNVFEAKVVEDIEASLRRRIISLRFKKEI